MLSVPASAHNTLPIHIQTNCRPSPCCPTCPMVSVSNSWLKTHLWEQQIYRAHQLLPFRLGSQPWHSLFCHWLHFHPQWRVSRMGDKKAAYSHTFFNRSWVHRSHQVCKTCRVENITAPAARFWNWPPTQHILQLGRSSSHCRKQGLPQAYKTHHNPVPLQPQCHRK